MNWLGEMVGNVTIREAQHRIRTSRIDNELRATTNSERVANLFELLGFRRQGSVDGQIRLVWALRLDGAL